MALILLTQVCNICGAPVFTSESPAQTVPSSAHRVPDTAHPAYSFARKRSYKRAVRRAAQSGDQHTYYRGRVCTLQQLCRGYQGRQAPPTASRRLLQASMSRTQHRLLTLTWHAGGLTQALWQELLLTLAHMQDADRPQIVCIQETHWTAAVAANFRTTGWEVYTSPTTDNKSAGLLTLVDKRLAGECQIVYADPKPGRLQHLRLIQGSWTADVINVYQKPYNSHPQAARQAREIRRDVWDALRKLLQVAPARNTLVLLGDFNSPIRPCAAAGTRINPGRQTGAMPPDQAHLQQLLEDFSLLHVNSWCRAAGATYHHGKGASLIDHILLRASQSDARAKQSRPLRLGLAAWRLGGYHLPVQASIIMIRFDSLNRAPQLKRQWDHWGLVQACQDWTDPRLQQLRCLVRRTLTQATDLAQMHHILIQCAAQVFPPPQGHQRLALWQTPPMQAGIKSMWQHYRDWKRARQQHQGNPLFISRCYHAFKEAHKAFRRAGKEARKHWFYSRLQDLTGCCCLQGLSCPACRRSYSCTEACPAEGTTARQGWPTPGPYHAGPTAGTALSQALCYR